MADAPKWMNRLAPAASDEQALQHWLMQQSKIELRGPVAMAEAAWFAALQWREVAHGVAETDGEPFPGKPLMKGNAA